jgi:mycoredoxin
MSGEEGLVVYGTPGCGAVRRARLFLEQHRIPYRFIDIDRNEPAARHVENLASGFRSVPTLEWPDGSVLVEPSTKELADKIGVKG